jgi:hypothetical protein
MGKMKVDEDRLTEWLVQQPRLPVGRSVAPYGVRRGPSVGLTTLRKRFPTLPKPTPGAVHARVAPGSYPPHVQVLDRRAEPAPTNAHGGGALSPDPIPPQRSAL